LDWITQVPVAVPYLPSLTWSVLIWTGFFAGAAFFVAQIVWRFQRAYRATAQAAEADRLLARGSLISDGLVFLVCLLGVLIGVLAAHFPRVRQPVTVNQFVFTLLFLGMALALLAKSAILDHYHRAALVAIHRERLQRSSA
jgi:uncharacterized membrane protein